MRNTAVIIGAGPGGAAAAVRLAQRGVKDVMLIDKDRFPRDKTCGSALSPNGLEIARRARRRRRGASGAATHIDPPKVVTPGDREMHLTTSAGSGDGPLRKHFDNLLVERARPSASTFRAGFRAQELVREGAGASSACARSDSEVLRGDYVIAADGAHSDLLGRPAAASAPSRR